MTAAGAAPAPATTTTPVATVSASSAATPAALPPATAAGGDFSTANGTAAVAAATAAAAVAGADTAPLFVSPGGYNPHAGVVMGASTAGFGDASGVLDAAAQAAHAAQVLLLPPEQRAGLLQAQAQQQQLAVQVRNPVCVFLC